MKKQIIATVLMAAFAAPTFAISDHFKEEMFGNQPERIQVVELSKQEMIETEGKWIGNAIGAVIGGVSAHYGYMAGSIASGKYNAWGHIGAVLGGAATGAINPVTSAKSALTAFGSGVAVGGVVSDLGNQGETVNINHVENKPSPPVSPPVNQANNQSGGWIMIDRASN